MPKLAVVKQHMGRVAQKLALVTGAAQGLGAAISHKLAAEGARVLLTDINDAGVQETAQAIGAEHADRAVAVCHDVSSEDSWRQVVEVAHRELGGLHILVNNAGIGSLANVEEETLSTWHKVHQIDLDSVFLGSKYAIPVMAQSGGGSIVNISSISGIVASHNFAAYNSAKAAVRHLSKSIALHCARAGNGIRCNSVHPAFIDTAILDGFTPAGGDRQQVINKLSRQVPLGRIGEPDDVAHAVLYLASDEAKFVTGTELIIDGGISAR